MASRMRTFDVAAIDGQGRTHALQIDAFDVEQVRTKTLEMRLQLTHCTEASRQKLRLQFGAYGSGHDVLDPIAFAQDLATLLEAGVSVREAIGALALKERNRARCAILESLRTGIAHGKTLSAAMQSTGGLPALMIATVAASEETGDLAIGLARYAKHQENLRAVRDKVVGACVYPALLLLVGSAVIALLLGVVVPRFATLIDANARSLPWMSRLLMEWGQMVAHNGWIAPMLFLGLGLFLVTLAVQLRNPVRRRALLQILPGVAEVAREFQHLQMYRTSAILTSRGITIHKALSFSTEFLDAQDQLRLQNCLLSIHQGKAPSSAMADSGLADVVVQSMLNVAERTGAMADMLDRIADLHERSLQRKIDLLSRLIEPILMIIFGALIGGIVVMMYLPIFDLASSIS